MPPLPFLERSGTFTSRTSRPHPRSRCIWRSGEATGLWVIFYLVLATTPALAQTGVVEGRVFDAETGQRLQGANVTIQDSGLGAATDAEGHFRVAGVEAGPRTLVVSFLGYGTVRVPITVVAGDVVEEDVELSEASVLGDEIIVTSQLEGQQQAINEQLSSNTIVNVVAKDRIRELPDQNAAESVGRLPGISLQRDAGEGQKLVVRGLSPRFNSITINGERIPSTDASNRSVDLSLVSPYVLDGIEVYKALTPDRDADAIGGTVNLVVRQAPEGLRGEASAHYGYNAQTGQLGQFRANVTGSNRFLNGRLGVLATGSVQQADRGSDILTADYVFNQGQGSESVIEIENLNLALREETRQRFNASVALDYDLGNGDLLWSSFFGRTERDELRTRKRYRVGSFRTEYDLRDRELFTQLYTNILSGRHDFSAIEIDWQLAHSFTLNKTPYSNYARFVETGAFSNGLEFDQGPEVIPGFAINDLDATWFQYGTFNPERTSDINRTAELNATVPYRLARGVGGYFKIGGKIRDKERKRDLDEFRTPFAEIDRIAEDNPGRFDLYRETNVLFGNFADAAFETEEVLDGQYSINASLDRRLINGFYEEFQARYLTNYFTELSDYTAGETITAGYGMTELNFGRKMMVLAGVRYEYTRNDYSGSVGSLRGNLGEIGVIEDSTGGRSYGELLPMVHVRYRVLPTLDLRLALTRSLSRPDYFNLVPYERINESELLLDRGNPNIRHTTAWNYDVVVSYTSTIGLFTAAGFYKQLYDIDYVKDQFRVQSGPFANYRITEPTNAPESKVYGVELDFQGNLAFLRGRSTIEQFLSGFVVNANFTYVFSETHFPYFEIGPRSPDPPYQPTLIDTVRAGRLPGQAVRIGNVSVGYERGGFSGRLSLVFQGNALHTVGRRAELDGFTDAFARWDASISQRLPFSKGLTLFLNLNNLTDTPEAAYLGQAVFPTLREHFGWTGDVGVRLLF